MDTYFFVIPCIRQCCQQHYCKCFIYNPLCKEISEYRWESLSGVCKCYCVWKTYFKKRAFKDRYWNLNLCNKHLKVIFVCFLSASLKHFNIRAPPSNPWLSDVLHEHRTKLRAAERKLSKLKDPSDLSMY